MSDTQSILFYASEIRLSEQHHPVTTGDGTATIYIRAVVVDGDWSDALDQISAHDGETLLNSIDHPLNK